MTIQALATLVAQTDLNQLVQRYTSAPRSSGNVNLYNCPHPSHPDQRPSFSVTTSRSGKQFARCFSQCAWQGDALEFVKWIENVNTAEAVQWLRSFLGTPGDGHSFLSNRTTPSKPLRSLSPKIENTSEVLTGESANRFMAQYLSARGWPQEVAEKFSLSVVLDDFNKARIRHPYLVPHESGTWVPGYWQDRGSKSSTVKWLSPKGSTPVLFNLRSLEVADLEAVVICEGAADTITATLALEGCKLVGVVGVPGASAWQPQWAHLFKGLRVLVVADNDTAGQALERAIANSLDTSPGFLRPEQGDLTDTAKAIGLSKVRESLLAALGTQPEATERSLEETLELLLAYFPQGSLVESAA
jgi:DNA primase